MILKKGGLVYEILKWYGYPDWRLEEGISLCKTFWSIMLGILLLAPGRGYLALEERLERDFGRVGVGAARVLLLGLCVLPVVRFIGGASWRDALIAVGLAMTFLVGLFGIWMGIVAIFTVLNKRYEASDIPGRMTDSVFEVVSLVGLALSAAKQKACPTIRFDGPPIETGLGDDN